MTETPSSSWALIEGASIVHGGASLGTLVGRPAALPGMGFQTLLNRLQAIDPLAPPETSALAQMRQCAAQARRIVSNPQAGLSTEKVAFLVSTYEAGILAGFSDLFFMAGIHKSGPFSEEELEAVGMIGWWHGDALRQRWCSDTSLVHVLSSSMMSTPRCGPIGPDEGIDGAGAS